MQDTKKNLIIVDYNKIRQNYLTYRNITKQECLCMPVTKGNGIGMGQLEVVDNLLKIDNPQKKYVVYSLEEALDLRNYFGDKLEEIYCLAGIRRGDEKFFYKNNLIPVVNNFEQLKIWSNFAKKQSKGLKTAMQINLGLNRTGVLEKDLLDVKEFVYDRDNCLELDMILGHIACQYDMNSSLGEKTTKKEYDYFLKVCELFPNVKRSIFASIMALLHPELALDASRPGEAIFSGFPIYDVQNRQVCELKTPITVLCPVYIENNSLYINYGIKDGISTCYKDYGYVLIDGKKIKIKKVEFDKIFLDVENSDIFKFENQEALLVGEYDNYSINGWEFAKMNNSSPCETIDKIAECARGSVNKYNELILLNAKKIDFESDFSELKPRGVVVFNKFGKIEQFYSKINEIIKIEKDGNYGYSARDEVKAGDYLASVSLGYADGFDRRFTFYDIELYIETNDKIIPCKLLKQVAMDIISVKIPEEYKNKVSVGDKLIVIDKSKNILADRLEKITGVSEEELFFLTKYSKRIRREFL